MLEYINFLLIILIIAVLIVDTIYISRVRKDISRLQTVNVDDNSIVDLSEFKRLNPEFKKHYKKYVVNGLMNPVVDEINKTIDEKKVNEYLANNEYEINRRIQELTTKM